MLKKFEEALTEIRRDTDLKMVCNFNGREIYLRFGDEGDLFYGGCFNIPPPSDFLRMIASEKWIVTSALTIEEIVYRVEYILPQWNSKYPKKKDIEALLNFAKERIKICERDKKP